MLTKLVRSTLLFAIAISATAQHVYFPPRGEWERRTPEQIVRKLRDAEAMLSAGQDVAAVLQALEVSEQTYYRWRSQYGGMKREEAKRLKQLEEFGLG